MNASNHAAILANDPAVTAARRRVMVFLSLKLG
jgi:hypothetical protein